MVALVQTLVKINWMSTRLWCKIGFYISTCFYHGRLYSSLLGKFFFCNYYAVGRRKGRFAFLFENGWKGRVSFWILFSVPANKWKLKILFLIALGITWLLYKFHLSGLKGVLNLLRSLSDEYKHLLVTYLELGKQFRWEAATLLCLKR